MPTRLISHLTLILVTLVAFYVSSLILDSGSQTDAISITSAYLCLSYLVIALLIGPLTVIRKGRSPSNSYIRRDIGIWAALNGLLHFYLANVLSMNTEYLDYYISNFPHPPSAEIRNSLYMWGTIVGYLVALLFILLLSLSNDWAVRKVGIKWWKRLQQTAYLIFIFTVVHAFAFQVLEDRQKIWMLVIAFLSVIVVWLQIRGYLARKSKNNKS